MYDIELCFDEGELSAYFEWRDDEVIGFFLSSEYRVLTFSQGDRRRGPATIIYHPFDPLPSGDLSTAEVVGVPLQPAQVPNEERTLEEPQSKPEDKTPEEVSPPVETEAPALIHSNCPTCSCSSKVKN